MNSKLSQKLTVSRRGFIAGAASTVAAVAGLGLVGCSDEEAGTTSGSAAGSAAAAASLAPVDAEEFATIIDNSVVADDATIAASTWATKVKEAGVLRVGSVQTDAFYSLLNEEDGKLYGFDAGLAQALAQYILGDPTAIENTQVTSDTRESVLQNDQVDAVFATYSINDDRKKVISFAGPYASTQQAILVTADNEDITSLDDLAGKTVAVQSGSTGPETLEEYQPDAEQEEFTTSEEAEAALKQGRVDAYVIDYEMLLGTIADNPGVYQIVGEQFGPSDGYGIGLPLDSDGVAFVNEWLQTIEDNGVWASLWKVSIGDRADIETPEPPAIEA